MNTKELDSKYVAHTYARFPLEIVRGKGALAYDEEGKEYLDLSSGIAVNTFGYGDEEWANSVSSQLLSLQHTSNLYYTSPCATLAKLLCEKTGMSKVFFSNSGAEANECAIKLARAHGEKKGGKDCFKIICLESSFHGRTLATLAATGQAVFHEKFQPLPEGFVFAKAGDIESVEKLIEENNCCAVFMELIQGEGGVNVLEKEFVQKVYSLAKENDLLFMIDEVQTGNGRTGKLYAYMHYDVKPDVFTTAKGLGGGLPIGACVMGEKAQDLLSFGDHGSTFGGNPAVCAGAVNIISRLTDEFLSEVTAKGEYLKKKLSETEGIREISGMGMMLGFLAEKESAEVISAAREKGLLVIKAKNKIRLLPPLCVTYEQLDKAVEILASCVR
ncbi:MAG: aspartate aminotransferase family protein [Clostridia bacterium]|nr:aspartate aminotransferase family protein [Clostridia bacterium]